MSRIFDNLGTGLSVTREDSGPTGHWVSAGLSTAVGHYGIRVFCGAGLVVGGGHSGQMSRLANDLRDKEQLAPMAAADHVKVAAMKPHTGPAAGKQDSGG